MQDFRKLKVWQEAHRLRLEVYRATRAFPKDERFGLTSQVRRSAASVPSNIAESCGYRGGAASARYLYVALGSRAETLDHLIAATDLGYLTSEEFQSHEQGLDVVRRMLIGLLKSMNASVPSRNSRRSLD